MDFTKVSTLLDALDFQDFQRIRQCLNAGQSLNQISPDEREGESIFLESAAGAYKERFQSLIAMREHVDLQALDTEGANVLIWCNGPYYLDICLRLGVNIHIIFRSPVFGEVNAFTYNIKCTEACLDGTYYKEERMAMALMLLSAGADPRDAKIPGKIKSQIRRWLASLDCAKRFFTKIFNNDSLECEVRDFLYHETFLRKALSN